jgi:hypothetical protein
MNINISVNDDAAINKQLWYNNASQNNISKSTKQEKQNERSATESA